MKIDDLTWRVQDKPGETFKVHRSIYTSQEIFDLEMEHLYEGNWIYLAHEAQIPNPNDYMTLFMGRQPVVLMRDNSGNINAFINACSHRGANICRHSKGNAKTFSCPYHGWVYGSNGKLLDVKAKAEGGYTPEWENRNYDLVRVPKVQSYRGFIFGSLSAEVDELETFLAAAKNMLDIQVDQHGGEDQIEFIRGMSTYTHRGNWKMQAENGVDGYHADVVHKSYFTLGMDRARRAEAAAGTDNVKAIQLPTNMADMKAGNYNLGNGHVMIWIEVANPKDRPAAFHYDKLLEQYGEKTTHWMTAKTRQTIFYPNFMLLDGLGAQFRVWRPITPDLTEVTIQCFGIKGEPAEARERRIRQYEDFYGGSGIATPDDLAAFDACQTGYYGTKAEWHDFDRGMTRIIDGPDDNANLINLKPDQSGPDMADEGLYHGEYRHWLKALTSKMK